MLKPENPASRKRHAMCEMLREKAISYHTRAEITECMNGKSDEEKELLAEKLLAIITESKTEQEMIDKAKLLNC